MQHNDNNNNDDDDDAPRVQSMATVRIRTSAHVTRPQQVIFVSPS